MLKFLVILVFMAAANAYSQSMIVLNNGKVLTIDNSGTLQDLSNFTLNYEIELVGGRFFINGDRKVFTVDQSGFFYSKEAEDKVARNVEYKGENYFISKTGKLFAVDAQGYLLEINREKEYKKLVHLGGNFFVSEFREGFKKVKALFVITGAGTVLKVQVPGLDLEFINYAGGRYFTTTDGTLYTVSTDGYVYSKQTMGRINGWQMKRGGNYFVYKSNLYSISDSGLLQSVGEAPNPYEVSHWGTNFILTRKGNLTTFSDSGSVRTNKVDFKASDISHFSSL